MVVKRKGRSIRSKFNFNKLFILLAIILVLIISALVIFYFMHKAPVINNLTLANPASTYCLDNGGGLKILEDEAGNQYGVCVFADNSSCDEWAYYLGECKVGDSLKK